MRTSFLLLSAALVLAACDDAAETTAPGSRSIVSSSAAQVSPAQNASGKPAPAFTTVTSVQSVPAIFGGPGNFQGWPTSGTMDVACPVGTQVIGGGYDVTGSYPHDMKIHTSTPNAINGWRVRVENTGSLGSTAHVKVTAICIK